MIHYVYLGVVIITEGNNTYKNENIILDVGKKLYFYKHLSVKRVTQQERRRMKTTYMRMGFCRFLTREVLRIEK